ncbi:MAG: DUF2520 domain-containing protein [Candidatus Dormibacteraeota bacterium]|nr:DUF2520 domain-containing protein [Candidatus Dormibacteraeota bacterium]
MRALGPQGEAVVFLTVPDRAVRAVAAKLAAGGPAIPDSVAFVHTSGALELEALAPLRGRHPVGSFHPLQSFSEPGPPSAFRGIVVAVDAGSPQLRRLLGRLARDLGANPKRVTDSRRSAYHAAAVFASNYLVALLGEAIDLLRLAGWTEKEAIQGLIPLAERTLANMRKRGVMAALTGPIRRGDSETVRRHLVALADVAAQPGRRSPSRTDVYRMLGQVALEIARKGGLEPAAAEQTRRALTRKVAATRRRSRA